MSAMRTVNARKLAAAQTELQGSLQIQALTSVHDRLASHEGELKYQLNFDSLLGQGLPLTRVRISFEAEVCLICERSLESYRQVLQSVSQVVLVSDERQAQGLPEEYEPFVCADEELDIAALLSEELILALPLVAINPDVAEWQPEAGPVNEQFEAEKQAQNPFASLAGLKKNPVTKD